MPRTEKLRTFRDYTTIGILASVRSFAAVHGVVQIRCFSGVLAIAEEEPLPFDLNCCAMHSHWKIDFEWQFVSRCISRCTSRPRWRSWFRAPVSQSICESPPESPRWLSSIPSARRLRSRDAGRSARHALLMQGAASLRRGGEAHAGWLPYESP
jgi:hypothetical protein